VSIPVQGLGSLGIAHALALLASLASAAVYAQWLDAGTLAGWAVALTAARASLLLLDAGLKTALVRRADALAAAGQRLLQRATAVAASLLVAGVALAAWMAPLAWLPAPGLTVLAVAAYLLSHTLLLPAIVQLERQGHFGAVGRAEALGTLIEFGAPALLMALGVAPLPALSFGLVVGRLLRAGLLVHAVRSTSVREQPGAEQAVRAPDAGLLREGLQLQGVALLSMARDTLHLWLLGPWFGAHWAGAYAFAMMACMVASQALVSLAARVALPALRPLSPAARLDVAGRALRLLAMVVLPPLAVLALLPWWGAPWLGERWDTALALLPALVLRVVITAPLAVLSPWLLVQAKPAVSLRVHAIWTAAETLATVAALAALGPTGLAWVWPLGGVLGLVLCVRALRAHGVSLAPLPAMLLRRPAPVRWGH
jgi:O-antigen/teichoic acid export membrane protein